MMKFFLILTFIAFNLFQKNGFSQDSSATMKSNIRSVWGDFDSTQLIKTEIIDWKKAPVGNKIIENGTVKAGFEYCDSIDVFKIVYNSDGYMVTGFMVKPKTKGKYPCVIFNRGGNRDYGQLKISMTLLKLGRIAASGYVVIASNYRGNSNSEGLEEFGGSDTRDVLNLIPALGQIDEADTSRIGMFGVSRGGMMTYLTLRQSCQIKAAAVIGGLTDLYILLEKRPEIEAGVLAQLIPAYYDSTDQILSDRSVTCWPEQLCPTTKLLILHGEKDDRCHVSMARELHRKLKRCGHPYQYVEFSDDDHGITNHIFQGLDMIVNWLDMYVKNDLPFDDTEHFVRIK